MERWELKMVCAALALVVSVLCSFLPFLLIRCTCLQRIKHKMAERKARRLKELAGEGESEAEKKKKKKKKKKQESEAAEAAEAAEADVDGNIASGEEGNFENWREKENKDGTAVEAKEESKKSNQEKGKTEEEDEEEEAKNPFQNENVLGVLMCFGGGVFFGTFLLHMLPEVNKLLQVSLLAPARISYPVTELIVAVGFFMILFVEELVNSCQRLRAEGMLCRRKSSANRDLRERTGEATASGTSGNMIEMNGSVDPGNQSQPSGHQHDYNNGDDSQQSHHHHNHYYSSRSIVLVLALSLHHIFEGLSIGLQKVTNNVWNLTLAVLCHETVICFSMGLQFFKDDQRLSTRVFVILLVASCVMPLGVVVGVAISESHQDAAAEDQHDWQNVLNGVLQALACGTFIYVTFFEILCEELGEGKSTPLKVIFVALGFGVMALLSLIPDAEEATVATSAGNTTTLPAFTRSRQ